jgi:hypothetical protein
MSKASLRRFNFSVHDQTGYVIAALPCCRRYLFCCLYAWKEHNAFVPLFYARYDSLFQGKTHTKKEEIYEINLSAL